jgi:predicted HTH domain antitoxin
MSGGYFDYKEWHIEQIADDVEKLIERNGREKTRDELKEEGWRDNDWYEKYPEDLQYYKYPDEVIEKFKEGIVILRQAAVYAQRIDWLLSGDDGEESFLKRLKEELGQLEK